MTWFPLLILSNAFLLKNKAFSQITLSVCNGTKTKNKRGKWTIHGIWYWISMKKGTKIKRLSLYTWHYAYPSHFMAANLLCPTGYMSEHASQLPSFCIHNPGVS